MNHKAKAALAGLASLCIPGAGQALQHRNPPAVGLLLSSAGLWWFFQLGYLVHLWAACDAALHRRS